MRAHVRVQNFWGILTISGHAYCFLKHATGRRATDSPTGDRVRLVCLFIAKSVFRFASEL